MEKRIIKKRRILSTPPDDSISAEERRHAATKKVAQTYTQKRESTVYSRFYSYKKDQETKGV
ncbi:hypothetical protein lbkm_0219 [Lachnospiraceae bacterium KM106-2]|nr:hypothetical protein lbkm_0219 [Lachnospiraceae bacterium KM106-2]